MFIIRFSFSSFQDYSRVGYDSHSISYSIIPDGKKRDEDDFEVPEHFTLEQARELAKRMKKCMEENGYGGWLAYRYALKGMGVKID